MKKNLILIFSLVLSVSNAQSPLKESDTDWESNSLLQKFVDLDPIGKQVNVYEDILKIKPKHIMSWSRSKELGRELSRAQSHFYNIKGCDFRVDTDIDKNVIGYEIVLSKFCSHFETTTPIRFDSRKSTLKDIISEMKVNFNQRPFTQQYRFTSLELDWRECGRMCVPDHNSLIQVVGISRYFHLNVELTFNSNDGIEKWKSEVLQHYGDIDLYLKNCTKNKGNGRCDPNPNGKFNRLAEALWENKVSDRFAISYPNSD